MSLLCTYEYKRITTKVQTVPIGVVHPIIVMSIAMQYANIILLLVANIYL